MATPGVPPGVRRLIADHLDSVALLEALLVVRAAPERAWSAGDVARALVTRPDHAQQLLDQLTAAGFIALASASGYRYEPGSRAADVEALAECYATRRPTVVGLVFAPRNAEAEALADAFRLRRRPS